jgi:hypothetical protein
LSAALRAPEGIVIASGKISAEKGDGRLELNRFFDRAIRAAFHDLGVADDVAAEYLASMLTRFARTENLYPRGTAMPRLETVVDMLLEIQAVWQDDSPDFRPEHEVTVRRHIGDYTLFMTGLFPERVQRTASMGYYVSEGTRAYRFVSEHDRARGGGERSPYRRLAERFEAYMRALDYARRAYFFGPGLPPFFRPTFG